jgi:uncharacterized protein DUF4337
MSDIAEAIDEAVHVARESRLNTVVAMLVAATATFMALCHVKAGSITRGMAEEQAAVVNSWSYYQAKSTKQNLAETTIDLLMVQREASGLAPQAVAALDQRLATYTDEVARYGREKNEIGEQAQLHQKNHDNLGIRRDQFDMAEGVLSLAIALLSVVALTQKRWLMVAAVIVVAGGVVLGLAGFVGWNVHPEWLAKILA